MHRDKHRYSFCYNIIIIIIIGSLFFLFWWRTLLLVYHSLARNDVCSIDNVASPVNRVCDIELNFLNLVMAFPDHNKTFSKNAHTGSFFFFFRIIFLIMFFFPNNAHYLYSAERGGDF